MGKNNSSEKILIWRGICEEYKDSHQFLNEIIIHTRKDIPDGILYMLNQEDLK